MRSRYSAYVLELVDYLLATWHPATRPGALPFERPGPRWLGLQVRSHRLDPDGVHAQVEFVARGKTSPGGRAHRLQELSRFVREDDRWYYVDGDTR
jgi:SEC-C motif-containing protein